MTLAAVGLRQCPACKSGRPNDDTGCPWCGLLLGTPAPTAPAAPAAPTRAVPGTAGAVYVDASERDGIAGLAVVGVLGDFTRRVTTKSSTTAERWALEWAFAIAREQNRRDLVFRSDCLSVVQRCAGDASRGWAVEHVPRTLNRRAHSFAVVARKRTLQPLHEGHP